MRILFKLLIALVIVLIAAIIALPFIIDPNDYKQQISEQVEKATGRQLSLEGDIALSVFPWIALELGPLSLSNAKGFTAQHFAKVEAAEIRIKLMPLLKKQLEMDTVILDGLVLNLEKNKAGVTNWDDLIAANKPTEQESDAKTDSQDSAEQADNSPALAAINIAGVRLSNANIFWSDLSSGEKYQLQNLNFKTASLVVNKPMAVELSFSVISDKQQAQADISFAADVIVDLDNQRYDLTNLELTTQAFAKKAGLDSADINLSGDISADMLSQLISINGLKLSVKAQKDQQTIAAELSAEITSNLATQQSKLNGLQLTAQISDPSLPGGEIDLDINTDVTVDMKQQTAILSNLLISAFDLLINADINASKLLSDSPVIAGNIAVKAFNLRQLANNLAIELPLMADDSTLKLVELNTTFSASAKHFNAKKLSVNLDQSKLTGQFAINNFAKPSFNFNLSLDQIDADRYLPPSVEQNANAPASAATTDAQATTANSAAADQLPLELLRQINAKGTLDIGKLKISGMHSEKIHLTINAAKGLVKLTPMSANLYQGQYNGNVVLDARGKSLKLSLNENLSGIQVEPLLNDLAGEAKLSGTADGQIKLSGSGMNITQIKQSLAGKGQFSFQDGALKGINIAESIRKAKAALKGQTLAASNEPVQTDFASLSGSFNIAKGILSNQDLQLMSPLLRISGAGKVDIPAEGIDYGLKVSIVGTSTGQQGKTLAELKGLTIPIKISGTFNDPKPSVDLASILKQKAADELKAKAAEKLQDKLGGELGGLLGGLLGTTPAPASEPENTSEEKSAEPVAPTAPAKSVEEQAKDALKDKLRSFF